MESQKELLHSSGQPYFDVFGPRLRFLNTPEQTGNQFCFMKAILPPGVAIPLHCHPDPETLYVEDGSLEFLQFKDDSHRWLMRTRDSFPIVQQECWGLCHPGYPATERHRADFE